MAKAKSLITLQTATGALSLPLAKATWLLWRFATYPMQLALGFYFFGTDGAVFVLLLMILNYRGNL